MDREPRLDSSDARDVVVRDVRMPFLSMVVFMVKWAIAAIPAMLVLTFIGVSGAILAWSLLGGLSSAVSQRGRKTELPVTSPPAAIPMARDRLTPPTVEPRETPPISEYISRHVRHEVRLFDSGGPFRAVGTVTNRGDRALRRLHGVLRCYGDHGRLLSQIPYTLNELRAGEIRYVSDQISDSVRTVELEFTGGTYR